MFIFCAIVSGPCCLTWCLADMKADQDELTALNRVTTEKEAQAKELKAVKRDLKGDLLAHVSSTASLTSPCFLTMIRGLIVIRENSMAQFKEVQWLVGFNRQKAEMLKRYFTPIYRSV